MRSKKQAEMLKPTVSSTRSKKEAEMLKPTVSSTRSKKEAEMLKPSSTRSKKKAEIKIVNVDGDLWVIETLDSSSVRDENEEEAEIKIKTVVI